MQYDDGKKEKLNRVERKLYSRNAPNIIDVSKPNSAEPIYSSNDFSNKGEEINEIKENWQDTKTSGFDELASKVSKMANKKSNFVKKVFIFSLLFFVIACGVAAFVFLGGMNSVSSKNVDIKVVGPLSVGGGQEVSFDINVINNNNVDLESASLLVEYPVGTRSPQDLTKELDRERFVLDKIESGESFNQNIKVVFFGEKESIKDLKISLEYRVANSSALFYKEKNYEVSISSAPIIITPTYPKEVNSNQEIIFNVEIASNSKDKVDNFLVNIEYPFGFVFKEAIPKATFGNNVWQFTGLASGDKKTLSIKGSIIGQDNEEKVFRINTGTPSVDDERMIAVPFSQLTESILIKKPFIGLGVFIEGENSNFVTQGGNQIATEILVKNNLPTKLFNVSVEATLKGGAFDQSSVFAGSSGFFQSFNNTILWDKRSASGLEDIEPGAERSLSFRLSPLSYSKVASGAKPEIEMTIKVKAERISDSGSVELVSATEIKKIILMTNINLSAKSVRSLGNIENSGPIPPRVNIPTTYTIVWSIANSFNQVSNVEVKAALPSYVKWNDLKSPTNEIISFNKTTNEIVWNVGSILPNTGFSSSKKEVYFQLELLPSTSQIGQAPILLGETSLSGIDKVTGLKINTRTNAVTTDFSSDTTFKTGDDRVVE